MVQTLLSSVLYVGKSSLLLIATMPDVEGIRDKGFVLSEVESFRVQFMASKKGFTLKGEVRHHFINREYM